MGSRLLHTAAANLVLVGALAAFHVSCMPPGMHLHFAGESGATSKRRMRICDGRAEMEIRSFSSIGVYCERYELSLYVRVKLLQKGHTISIAPEGLAALVGDSVMIVLRIGWIVYPIANFASMLTSSCGRICAYSGVAVRSLFELRWIASFLSMVNRLSSIRYVRLSVNGANESPDSLSCLLRMDKGSGPLVRGYRSLRVRFGSGIGQSQSC